MSAENFFLSLTELQAGRKKIKAPVTERKASPEIFFHKLTELKVAAKKIYRLARNGKCL